MAKMLQIRNVPEDVHRKLKARSAMVGKTLSDYLLEEVQRLAELPTPEELRERLAGREPVELSMSLADAVRAERDGR